ncbi:hypothetical protein RFI_30870 [Reticulomyxa filosa]|uniref:Uncharacterized protein n=1 Tax=Reticulomyxa filosa TaxID=46433 RepID=X6LYU2_RETFI|nr:hypothetical protein RFI_30870 [Reticulomyxa filosa]|eukprot:ETO06521.1 hypothetical protein RFI_30870 [Reticulomyxa filosa]
MGLFPRLVSWLLRAKSRESKERIYHVYLSKYNVMRESNGGQRLVSSLHPDGGEEEGGSSMAPDIVEIRSLSDLLLLQKHIHINEVFANRNDMVCSVSQICVTVGEQANKSKGPFLHLSYATFVEWYGAATVGSDKELNLFQYLEKCSSSSLSLLSSPSILSAKNNDDNDLVYTLFRDILYRRAMVKVWMIGCSVNSLGASLLTNEAKEEWISYLQMSGKWKHILPTTSAPHSPSLHKPMYVVPYDLLFSQMQQARERPTKPKTAIKSSSCTKKSPCWIKRLKHSDWKLRIHYTA